MKIVFSNTYSNYSFPPNFSQLLLSSLHPNMSYDFTFQEEAGLSEEKYHVLTDYFQ